MTSENPADENSALENSALENNAFASDPAKNKKRSGLTSPSFQGLLWTNWLTAINDNAFRWFVIGAGKTYYKPGEEGWVLMLATISFVVPYILLASPAGWLADRFAKRDVVVGCKILEIIVMVIGIASLLLGSITLLMISVFLMGAQSALFAPAKIGTIPEILDESEISTGNGIFNLATLSAVIIGMGIGGYLADFAGIKGQENIWLTGSVLIGLAVVGTIVSLLITPYKAANPTAKFPINVPLETRRNIAQLYAMSSLFRVGLGVVFFWSIASISQLNIDIFASESGSVNEVEKLPLLISLVLGLGVGSVMAGIASGGKIELGLVPWGALGIAVFSVLLFFTPADFITGGFNFKLVIACGLLAALGASAGFFDVPLASYLQKNSPPERLGEILSAVNCIAFAGIAIAALALQLLTAGAKQGDFASLPQSLRAASLTAPQQQNVKTVVADYESALAAAGDSDTVDLLEFAQRVQTPGRSQAINELVNSEIEFRKQNDQLTSMVRYQDTQRFPKSQQRQIKKVLQQSGALPWFSSRSVFLIFGLLTLPVFGYAFWRLPHAMVKMGWKLMLQFFYRIKIHGVENIPETGGAVMVVNHSTWLDGVIFRVFMPRKIRIIAYSGNFTNPIMKKWADFCGVILIGGGPKSIARAFKDARKALDDGELLGLFPEGGISRSQQVRSFKPGLMKILKGREVPIIPMYFDELWGSIFSYSKGRAFSKFPTSVRRPISIHIGPPVAPQPDSMLPIKTAVQRLSSTTMKNYVGKFVSPVSEFIYSCKRRKFQSKCVDSMKSEEKGGSLLLRSLVLRRLLSREVFTDGETTVGVLIPPTVGGAIVNLALGLDQRIVVNLNYSLSQDLINHCIKEAGIKHVLTTKKVMEKFQFDLDCEVVMLDNLKEKVSTADKAIAALQSFVVPGFLLNRMLGLHKIKSDDVMTVVFTSGSTGVPKGVMLTHENILFDVRGFEKAAAFKTSDTIMGILPFFHSFGYTITLWSPMMCDVRGAYHLNPLDAKQIGKLVEKYSGTILMATPTFLRSYMRRCTPEQFKTLDAVVTGAERLPPELAEQYHEKFGVMPVEGYGVTELSPAVAANIPLSRQSGKFQVDAKVGTVGRPIANVTVKVCHLETDEELPCNEPGMLWVSGPIVMKGYLNNPEATRGVIVDGWYKTGDVAKLDEDGFITITGRISRFSKIGGEMVPHLKIEEVLSQLLDRTPADDSDDHLTVAVTAVADQKKGERLIVLYACDHKTVDEMTAALSQAGLPNVFIPSSKSFFKVDELPILGTGKIDLKGIKDKAVELVAAE
jgi:acyl-[acyl-carrier-protein]-phospholipid O-acyltransferase/long-chain-fatty-acid--[acyl-carrier-protein] ligase